MQHELKLYYFPFSCSFVTMTALEKIGCAYDIEIINLFKGEQKQTEFLKVNPDGKVPALSVDGNILTENAAILSFLHESYPEAQLFPKVDSTFEKSKQLSDLFWISSTWHPSRRANVAPFQWTTGDVEPVRERGRELTRALLKQLDSALDGRTWYYGTEWSIIDVYFYFGYNLSAIIDFPLEEFPNVLAHKKRVEAYPAYQASAAKGQDIISKLNLKFPV